MLSDREEPSSTVIFPVKPQENRVYSHKKGSCRKLQPSRKLEGAQLCMETLGICSGVICSRPPVGFPWSFDTELEAQIAVTQVHTGTRGVKAKPLGVSPKTTHRPAVPREQGSNLHASRDVFIPG